MIAWLKGLSWVVILGAIGAAIMMVVNAHRAGKMEANVKHQEGRVKELNAGTTDDIKAAARLQNNITAKKILAREIRHRSEASLERLGQDETMADIAKRFNGKRVRHRPRTTT